MTTFQDPPRQSRRAVRQNEVRDSEQVEVDASVRPATARTGRRAQLPSATEWRSEAPDDSEVSVPAAAPLEPFTLTTQSISQISPPAEGVSAVSPAAKPDISEASRTSHGRRASLGEGELTPFVVSSDDTAAVAGSISTDTSVAETAEADTIASAAPGHSPVTPRDEPAGVDEVTAVPAAAENPLLVDEDAAPVPTTADVVVAAPALTRRELRERRAAAERAGQLGVPEAIGAILNSGPIILPYLSAAPARRVETANEEFDALTQEPDTSETDETVVAAAPVSTWALPLDPTPSAEKPAESDAPPADDSVISVPSFVEPAVAPASTRSAGHWSVRADMDDDIESLENTITRTVGVSSSLTTSALVLPSIPQSSDITTPYTASGEIMATGSIDLPRSLASTGAHPSRVDTSDFEMDSLDHEVPSTDSAPVRAIRAVSTHTGSNGMITTKKQSNRTLTVLVISASTMAVGVAGLLIAGFALRIFP